MVLVHCVEDSAINVLLIVRNVYLVKMDKNIIRIQIHVQNLANSHKYHISIRILLIKYVIHAIHPVNYVHLIHKTV
jgi:hypothetical protein